MRSNKTGRIAFSILAVALGLFSVSAYSQTPRGRAKPLATPPTRVLTGAEIIAQGGDVEEQPIVTPVERPTRSATTNAGRIKELNDRLKKLETAKKNDYDEQQKRLLMNLDIITRAEGRTESLRKQLFEMIEKENTIQGRLEQINYDSRPEAIERALQIAGSLRPEEVRENRRKSLDAERRNLESLLTQVQATRLSLESNLQRAEFMLEKLRIKLEKDIDNAFPADPSDEPEN